MKPSLNIVAVLIFACGTAGAAVAQERVTPAQSRGGKPLDAPWENMPAELRGMKFPNWPLPDDLQRWQRVDRDQTRKTLLECLGDLPPRPQPLEVKTLAREDRGEYVLERFEFHNGIEILERKVGQVYRLHQQPAVFQSVVYKNTGHEYLPEMRGRMVDWFERHLQ